MKKRPTSKLSICLVLSLALTIVCALALTFALSPTCQIAFAQDASFTQVFPTTDYFQSANPAKVSANNAYLLVYDDVAHKLFVRGGGNVSTVVYDAPFESVKDIFAIGNVAFLNCEQGYYTLDLSLASSSWLKRELQKPANITAFNSDGTYLYAHSASGSVYVYDQNLDFAFATETIDDLDFSGKYTVVMGEGSLLYVFSIDSTGRYYMSYDISSSTKSDKIYLKGGALINKAYVGDVIYALKSFDDVSYIVCVDKKSGEELFSTDISPDSFFAYGNKLFTISTDCVTVYTLNSDKTALRLDSSITMSGSDEGHFNAPADLVKDGDKLVVADSKNKRLSIVESGEMSCVYFEDEPLRIAQSQYDYYVAFSDCVRRVSNGVVTKTYMINGIVDVAYLDKLYVLTADGVYIFIGDNAVKLADSNGATRIASAKDGTNLYLLCSDKIATIDRNGNSLPSLAQDDFSEAIDIAIDYVGKITIAFKNGYKQYYDGTKDEFSFTDTSTKATISSVYLDENSLYFTTEECFVGKCSVNATSKLTFTNINFFAPSKDDIVSFAKAKDGALAYSLDRRKENTSLATDDVYMIYTGRTVNQLENYRYALQGSNIVIIDENDFDILQTNTLTGDYVATKSTTLYAVPYCEDGKISISNGTVVARKNDCANFENGKWIAVQYGENTYYAVASDFEEYTIQIPEKDKIYGKANADRVGGLVNVYANADDNSEVIAQIVDGSKVEVLETLDDYYLVSFDGKVGYVKKSQLKIEGLTSVQIVAIVLAIVVALAGTAIFASIYITRKNTDNKKTEDKTQKRF